MHTCPVPPMEPLAQVKVIEKDDGVGVAGSAVAVGDEATVGVAFPVVGATAWPLVWPAGVLRGLPAVDVSKPPPSAATLASVQTSTMTLTAATITPTRARRDDVRNRCQTVRCGRPGTAYPPDAAGVQGGAVCCSERVAPSVSAAVSSVRPVGRFAANGSSSGSGGHLGKSGSCCQSACPAVDPGAAPASGSSLALRCIASPSVRGFG